MLILKRELCTCSYYFIRALGKKVDIILTNLGCYKDEKCYDGKKQQHKYMFKSYQ